MRDGCPYCGNEDTRPLYCKPVRPGLRKCYACYRQFTPRVATVRRASKLQDAVWDKAADLFADGLSARQVGLALGVQYRTAWLLKKRLETAQ